MCEYTYAQKEKGIQKNIGYNPHAILSPEELIEFSISVCGFQKIIEYSSEQREQ